MKKYLLVAITAGSLLVAGCSNSSNNNVSKVPSGANCPENVAYLQEGANKYKEAFGNYPTDVQKLLEASNGKGPFVEKVPECPGGNVYIIENGTVREK